MSGAASPVEWRPEAAGDLEAIFAYLATRNPVAARRLVRALTAAADALATFPNRGRAGRAVGTRELVTVHPYIVVYEVAPDGAVTILRLWHGAQDRP